MENKMVSVIQAQEVNPLLIIIFSIFPLLVMLVSSRFGRNPYPPGPKGWPLIGNISMMHQLTHRNLAKLAEQYGGVLHLRIGFRHITAISSPDAAHQVLKVHDSIFCNRPANICIRYLTYDRADLVFADYGPFWRQMRKLCVTKLLSRQRAESWASVDDEIGCMVRQVAAGAGAAVNIGELMFGLTRSIMYRAAFGSGSRDGQDGFMDIFSELSKLFGTLSVADFIPWLGCVDFHGLRARLAKARDSLDRFIDTVIDDHVQKKKIGDDADMVDELLAFNSDEDSHNSIKLTRNNIKGIIMDIMFGGTETVAFAVEWVMAELLRNPTHLHKVQRELADVAGLARKVEEPDLERLTYLRCCIKESLRLHPPIPLLLHETTEDATISGYHVPAKSRVMINVWAIGRDGGAWEDAEEFKPERFLKDGAPDFKGNNFEFLPFGSGRRSCPAIQLGTYALEMAVAHLLHCFTWELPGGVGPNDLDMNDVVGLTARGPRGWLCWLLPGCSAPFEIRLCTFRFPQLNCFVFFLFFFLSQIIFRLL